MGCVRGREEVAFLDSIPGPSAGHVTSCHFLEIPLNHRPMNTPTLSQLQHGLAIFEQIAALETELAALFNGAAPASAAKAPTAPKAPAKQKRKPMSPAVKAKLSAMMKARWEAKKAG